MDVITPLVAPIDDRSVLPSRLYRPWSAARWYREGRISEKVLVELLAELPEAAIPGPPCRPEWREAMSAAVREGYCYEALFQCFTSTSSARRSARRPMSVIESCLALAEDERRSRPSRARAQADRRSHTPGAA